MLDGGVQRVRDAGDVAAELAGAVRLPLCDRTSADAACGREIILGEAAGAAKGAYACADGWHDIRHGVKATLEELTIP